MALHSFSAARVVQVPIEAMWRTAAHATTDLCHALKMRCGTAQTNKHTFSGCAAAASGSMLLREYELANGQVSKVGLLVLARVVSPHTFVFWLLLRSKVISRQTQQANGDRFKQPSCANATDCTLATVLMRNVTIWLAKTWFSNPHVRDGQVSAWEEERFMRMLHGLFVCLH